jgi:hypothetical protein
MDLAYHHNKGLPIVHINLECLVRGRAGPTVSNPVVADVARIEAAQISRSKDVTGWVADCIRIDRHALSCTTGVGERVSIVMVDSRIASDRARRSWRTGLRKATVEEFTSLRGILNGDASVNHDRRARRASGRRGSDTSADQPVTRKSEAIDGTNGIVVADIVDVHRRAVAVRRDPAPHLARGGLVEALVEMLGAVVHRSHITNEEAGESANIHRRIKRVIDECVRPFILNRAPDRSQQHRVVRISVPIWIAPNGDGHCRPIVQRVWEKGSAPGDAHGSN